MKEAPAIQNMQHFNSVGQLFIGRSLVSKYSLLWPTSGHCSLLIRSFQIFHVTTYLQRILIAATTGAKTALISGSLRLLSSLRSSSRIGWWLNRCHVCERRHYLSCRSDCPQWQLIAISAVLLQPGTGPRYEAVKGDFHDIGILRTTVDRNWASGGIYLYTGTIVPHPPTSFVSTAPVFNYSGDFP